MYPRLDGHELASKAVIVIEEKGELFLQLVYQLGEAFMGFRLASRSTCHRAYDLHDNGAYANPSDGGKQNDDRL